MNGKTICRVILTVFLCGATVPGAGAAMVENESDVVLDSLVVDSVATDSAVCETNTDVTPEAKANPYRFSPMQLVVPGVLVGVGIVGLESDWLKYQNREIREELKENIDSKFTLDDISQYAPMAATYGLNLCGVRGMHGYGDLTIILGTAYALMGLTVNSMKAITRVERPDGSSRNSFPSGHTATAFMGAELLRREYWGKSPWIGVAGYAVAAGTGFFRMYNNRHWLTDVIAGAGMGIFCTQAAYWLYPTIAKTFFHKRYLKNTYIFPALSKESKGLGCVIRF